MKSPPNEASRLTGFGLWLVALCTAPVAYAQVPGPGGVPSAARDEKALEDVRREVQRFEKAAQSYRGTVQHVVHQSYVEKRNALQQRYDATVKKEEAEEKDLRQQAIARFGLRATLPRALNVIMGPGCPVCITDMPEIDEAYALAMQGVRVATYGEDRKSVV